MDISESGIEELEHLKLGYGKLLLEYKKLTNLCNEIIKNINLENAAQFFIELKDLMKYIYKYIDPEFKAFTKKLSLKFFINYNEKLLIAIKDFCLIRKCDCEGDLEKIDERLMEIGHKVFKELPNPKEDMRYIKKKQLNQVQRDYIYESFDEKYGINEIQK